MDPCCQDCEWGGGGGWTQGDVEEMDGSLLPRERVGGGPKETWRRWEDPCCQESEGRPQETWRRRYGWSPAAKRASGRPQETWRRRVDPDEKKRKGGETPGDVEEMCGPLTARERRRDPTKRRRGWWSGRRKISGGVWARSQVLQRRAGNNGNFGVGLIYTLPPSPPIYTHMERIKSVSKAVAACQSGYRK